MVLGSLGITLWLLGQQAPVLGQSTHYVNEQSNLQLVQSIAGKVVKYHAKAAADQRANAALSVVALPSTQNYYKIEGQAVTCMFDAIRGRLLTISLKDFTRDTKFVNEQIESQCWDEAKTFFASIDPEVELRLKSSHYSQRNGTWEFSGSQLLRGVPVGEIDDFKIIVDAYSGAPLFTNKGLRPGYPKAKKPATNLDGAFLAASNLVLQHFGGEVCELLKPAALEIMRLPEAPPAGARTDWFYLDLSKDDVMARESGSGVFAIRVDLRETGRQPARAFSAFLDARTLRPIFVMNFPSNGNAASKSSESALTRPELNGKLVIQGKKRVVVDGSKFAASQPPASFSPSSTVLVSTREKVWKVVFDNSLTLARMSLSTGDVYFKVDASTAQVVKKALAPK